jgi:hypothetical protein
VLCGLYYVLRYFGKEWINWLLGWYFAFVGVGSMWKVFMSLAIRVLINYSITVSHLVDKVCPGRGYVE